MKQYEFRLLGADGKANATLRRDCATDEAAISMARTLMSGYSWVEVWLGSHVLARFPSH